MRHTAAAGGGARAGATSRADACGAGARAGGGRARRGARLSEAAAAPRQQWQTIASPERDATVACAAIAVAARQWRVSRYRRRWRRRGRRRRRGGGSQQGEQQFDQPQWIEPQSERGRPALVAARQRVGRGNNCPAAARKRRAAATVRAGGDLRHQVHAVAGGARGTVQAAHIDERQARADSARRQDRRRRRHRRRRGRRAATRFAAARHVATFRRHVAAAHVRHACRVLTARRPQRAAPVAATAAAAGTAPGTAPGPPR